MITLNRSIFSHQVHRVRGSIRSLGRSMIVLGCGLGLLLGASQLQAQSNQLFFLDFDTMTNAEFQYDYSAAERQQIAQEMDQLFAPLGMSVTHLTPDPDTFFSTVFFNADVPGTSDGVDFRNRSVTDNAQLNALMLLDFVGATDITSDKVVRTSINTGMHEALHLVGVRHHDAFTPFGIGIHPASVSRFDPDYPGPVEPTEIAMADRTFMSMTLGMGGISEATLTRDDRMIGLRGAAKVAMIDVPVFDGSNASNNPLFPTPLPMHQIDVPNTLPEDLVLPPGMNPGVDPQDLIFTADVAIAEGSLEGEPDYYTFPFQIGELYTIELYADVLGHRQNFDPTDGTLRVLEWVGQENMILEPIDYYGVDAENFKATDGTDPALIDLLIPPPNPDSPPGFFGVYIIEVDGTFGDYELVIYRMTVIPEPSSLALLSIAGLVLFARRRGSKPKLVHR